MFRQTKENRHYHTEYYTEKECPTKFPERGDAGAGKHTWGTCGDTHQILESILGKGGHWGPWPMGPHL